MPTTPATGSQTLSRGIRLLEILAAAERGMSIDELAAALGVHRSVAYRLLRTLEEHGLISRGAGGVVALGAGLAALASSVSRDLQQAAWPELTEAADELGMTCLLVMLEQDEGITVVSAPPRRTVAVSYQPGHRHPITRGAPGKAMLMELPEAAWPEEASRALRAEIADSRARGYATSHDEVVPSLWSVAVPLAVPGQPLTSVAAIHVSLPRTEAEIAERLHAAASGIARALGA
ncbi:IclR family transcriptional regulator [Microbacterium marinilacus]|uniref:Helix-turn-helix domain-containing protein n=1 Tax=Microbacterium marinilacus TaxID=415209 RepID=A0ABP7B9B7_9MICO|nr:helix-turn-helix domain-containing protein [Microbacterium marinilacus]MBY0687145.1 helix-turn-helix domain-containing protein [Microbacterium marinilacus]